MVVNRKFCCKLQHRTFTICWYLPRRWRSCKPGLETIDFDSGILSQKNSLEKNNFDIEKNLNWVSESEICWSFVRWWFAAADWNREIVILGEIRNCLLKCLINGAIRWKIYPARRKWTRNAALRVKRFVLEVGKYDRIAVNITCVLYILFYDYCVICV